jgi:zinc protease
VGDVDEKGALEIVRQQYGALPPSTLPEKKFAAEPAQPGERRKDVKKPTATQKIMLGYKSPAIASADHAALTVLNEVLFGGRSSRIYRALVKAKEIATDIRGWVGTFVDPALYEMYVTARAEHTCDELEAALFGELDKVRNAEITIEELEKAQARLELSFLQGMETASGKAEQIGFYDTILGDPGAGFARLELYRKTTAQDLLRVAKAYLVAEHRTIMRVFPDGTAAENEEGEGGEGGEAAS